MEAYSVDELELRAGREGTYDDRGEAGRPCLPELLEFPQRQGNVRFVTRECPG